MNKAFTISLLALLMLSVGCSSVDVATAPGKTISFTVGNYSHQTRAAGDTVSLNSLGITSFSSRAYLHAEGVENEQYFFGTAANPVETVSYDGTSQWIPSHSYFWPKSPNSYVNFISWYGVAPTVNYAKNASDKYEATFTWSDVNPETNANLMFADMAWHYNANENLAVYNDYSGVTEGVPTLFRHALAQIRFLGQLSKDSDTGITWNVKVTGLTLGGVYNTGSLTLTCEDPGTKKTKEWTDSGWTTSGTAVNIDSSDEVTLSSTTAGTILDWTTVIPQTVSNSMILTINFNIVTKYGNPDSPTLVVEEPYIAAVALSDFSSAVSSWDRGKRITYTITFNPDAQMIKIVPAGEDWVVNPWYNISVE